MTAQLRGSRAAGYRSTHPIECAHCHKTFSVSGQALEDRQGPYIALWPVVPTAAEYTEAELRHVLHGPKPSVLETGVALPQPPGRVHLPADPVPNFNGVD